MGGEATLGEGPIRERRLSRGRESSIVEIGIPGKKRAKLRNKKAQPLKKKWGKVAQFFQGRGEKRGLKEKAGEIQEADQLLERNRIKRRRGLQNGHQQNLRGTGNVGI